MPIFQKSVLNSIKQDESLIASRWNNFQNYIDKIDYIKTVKEEKYQDGFLKDIFESCLGYTLDSTNPANFNLEREKKNETDGKKADGVIYVNGEVIGIVELKDQKTKNLDAVEGQAFNYHASHSNSKYIIISNFDELRFYIDKKTAYEKFNLFNLSYEDFRTLHLLLSYESIKENIPLKLKEKSTNFEQTISKELYRDFSAFRTHLFENIVKNNYVPVRGEPVEPQHPSTSSGRTELDKQTLLRLTQKLCDRIIFILFSEDRELLKKETIKEIRTRHASDGFGDRSLYDYYKLYFNAINTGNDKLGIPKYNGGLFATDELLDSLMIDDAYLDMEAQKLSNYNFMTDISVNILGHIFEQSLTDLEEMNASINDEAFDKKKSKRKKDGVFYTPEYITRYIVENTLGKLCSDKKAELKIEAETVVVNPRKLTKAEQTYKEILLNYREWLTHLKILDPACGSGAFLNQALEFLIREHTLIRDLLLPYEDLMIGYEIEKSILEHNLYGVDINEDAVEIAKLSLWLRTAHKGRELTSLNNKIKCGNSLINDKNIAENAFVWEEEFPEVFVQGGFDVIIGNPPYVDLKSLPKIFNDYLFSAYNTANNRINLFSIFIEKSICVLNNMGIFSFIIPSSLLTQESYKKSRQYLLENVQLDKIIRLPNESFGGNAGDVKVDTIILVCQHKEKQKDDIEIVVYKGFNRITEIEPHSADNHFFANQEDWMKDEDCIFRINFSNSAISILEKCEKDIKKLVECADFCLGLTPYDKYRGHTEEQIQNKVFHSNFQKDESYKKLLAGNDITRYSVSWNGDQWISYGKWLGAPREKRFFTDKRILVKQIIDWTAKKIWATLTTEELYNTQNAFNIVPKDNYTGEYLLAIINSELMSFYHRKKFLEEYKDRFQKILIKDCKEFPIKEISEKDQQPFIVKIDLMLSLTKQFQFAKQNFLNELRLEKIPQKLQKFDELEFDEFVKEYTKAKKLKFADKLEERNFKNDWSALFENDKKAVLELKAEIAKTDKEIDVMVYELYELSEDEIAIVEGK